MFNSAAQGLTDIIVYQPGKDRLVSACYKQAHIYRTQESNTNKTQGMVIPLV